MRRLAASLAINGVLPVAAYTLSRPHCAGVTALVAGAALPVVWTVVNLVRRRRLDPVGVLSVVGFGGALLFSWLSGGSALPILLRHAVPTGTLGLSCLVSVVARRPLLLLVRGRFVRPGPGSERQSPADRRHHTVLTAMVGATLLAHAVVATVLALSLPVSTYLVVSRPVLLAVTGAGGSAVAWYVRRVRAARRTASYQDRSADADALLGRLGGSRPDRHD